jgi:hypothetical protein
MRLRTLQMPLAGWLLFATVLAAGTARAIRVPRPVDGVTRRAIPSTIVVQRTTRAAHRAAVAPTPSGLRRSKVADRAEKEKAAAMLLLLMLGQDRLAAVSR